MIFADNLTNFCSHQAVICQNGHSLRYSDLATEADQVFSSMVKGRMLVALECRNDLDTLLIYIACLRSKHVVVLLPANQSDSFYALFCKNFKPNIIWRIKNGDLIKEEVHSKQATMHPDLAILLTTSGSTGASKYVRLSYTNLQSNASSIGEYLALNDEERPITTLPFQYSYGLSIINSHLMAGATILLTESTLFDREFWLFFKRSGATSFGGVPYSYEILDKLRFERMELPSLRYFTQAGGRLKPELVKKYAALADKWKVQFLVMYGQTEATARIAYLPAHRLKDKSGSIGIAIPGGKICIQSKQGDTITTPGEQGELVYCGANVMMGYACDVGDLSKGYELDRLQTGDTGYFDEDGYFYICGRKSRIIKLHGSRLDLGDLESRLEQLGFNTICTGIDDDLRVFTQDKKQKALACLLVEDLGIKGHCLTVRYIKDIPRLVTGKVNYAALIENSGK